jgi:hypothetical protein
MGEGHRCHECTPPIALDALHSVWPIASADGIICINMIHISPWEATVGLIKGAAAISLRDRRCISTVHTSAKGSQRPEQPGIDRSLAGDRSDWRHLVFFRHITTGLENFNNVLALAFGVLIVIVVGFMTWIWLSVVIVLIGAELDAAIEKQTSRESDRRVVRHRPI